MIIQSLSLKNFRSHLKTHIDFNIGTTLITGENGAGKSSILDAIDFVIFNHYSTKKIEDLITIGQDKMSVKIKLAVDENNYLISRELTRNSSNNIIKMKMGDKYIPIKSKNQKTINEIQSILKINANIFNNFIYLKPEHMSSLIGKKEILQLLEKNKEKFRSEIEKNKHIKTPTERIPLSNKISDLKNIEEQIELLKPFLNNEIDLISLLENFDDFSQIMRDNEKYFNEYSDLKMQIISLEYAKDQFGENKVRLGQYLTRKIKIENKISQTTLKIGNYLKKFSKNLDKEFKSAQELEFHFNQINLKIESEIFETTVTIENVKEEISKLKMMNQLIETSITQLKTTGESCPNCELIITPEKRKELIHNYNQDIEKNNLKIKNLNGTLDDLTNKKTALKLKKPQTENKNLDILKKYNESVKEWTEEIEIINRNTEELNKNLVILKNIEQDIETKQKHLADIKPKYEEYIVAHDNLELLEEVNRIDEKIGSLNFPVNVNKSFQNEVDFKNGELNNLSEEIITIEELDLLSNSISAIKNKLDSFKDAQNTLPNIMDFLNLLKCFKEEYCENGVQKDLINVSRQLLEHKTSEIFEKFNLGYSNIRLDENYNITICGLDGEKSFDMLSSTEKIVLNLSLRLTILDLFSDNLELIMLDEPIPKLDNNKELYDNLKKLFISQIIIVSNDSYLQNVVDNIIKINHYQNISFIDS